MTTHTTHTTQATHRTQATHSTERTATSTTRPTLFTPAFLALALATLAYFTAEGMLIPALPRYVAGPLDGGNVAVGIVFGTFSLSAVLLRPVAGVLGDRRGRRPVMIAGAAIFALSVLTYGFATTPAALAGLRLISGVGEALFFVGMLTAFADLAPADRRGEAMSLASLALYVGIGTGPLAAELLLARFGFAAVWVGAAAAALGAVALVLRVPETRPVGASPVGVAASRAGAAPSGRRFVHPAGVVPGLVLLASLVGMAGFLAFVPLHVHDLGLQGSAGILALFAAIVVVVRSAGARLPDLLGPARAIRAALALSALGLAVLGGWHHPLGLVGGTTFLALGIALLTPSVFALAVAAVPANERGQVMATTSAFIDIAFGVGPVSMGIVAASLGRPAVFLAGALIAGAGLVLVAVVRVGRSRPVIDGPATLASA